MPPFTKNTTKNAAVDRSPFFAPSTPKHEARTPGGTSCQVKGIVEHKATVLGTSANLINAIVGAGIAGIPYALREAGMLTGLFLVILCALLTNKSLRLLVETAKHTNVPSYETLAEACLGRTGFLFVSINMFIMAYGAMVSYLMIIKDTLPVLMGVSPDDLPLKRAVLFVISLTIIVPLSSQRDMADLAKTSRLAVLFDALVVLVVVLVSPWQETDFVATLQTSIIRPDTVFVGLGVLSFAFVCQHSAFIIAGSLENPTKQRWSQSAFYAVIVCSVLATVCGLSGYLGYLEGTQGNILNTLGTSAGANIARGLLGTTMLFVFPLEAFVARHVCVVLLFSGRRAHEGEDAAVLSRRDRRISLTMALYVLALIPAICFEDLGDVLSMTGAVGGSCLSYIGPGLTYLGVHGAEFVDFVRHYFGNSYWPKHAEDEEREHHGDAWYRVIWKSILWYGMLMPLWCTIATIGSVKVTCHQEEMALKSPHPIRIGKVKQTRILQLAAKRLESVRPDSADIETAPLMIKSESLHIIGDRNVLPPASLSYQKTPLARVDVPEPKLVQQSSAVGVDEASEEDPQADPPQVSDFIIAVGYMIFGVIALAAGLVSIAMKGKD